MSELASPRSEDSDDRELKQLADGSTDEEEEQQKYQGNNEEACKIDDDCDDDSLDDLARFKKMHNPVAAHILQKSRSEREFRLTVSDDRVEIVTPDKDAIILQQGPPVSLVIDSHSSAKRLSRGSKEMSVILSRPATEQNQRPDTEIEEEQKDGKELNESINQKDLTGKPVMRSPRTPKSRAKSKTPESQPVSQNSLQGEETEEGNMQSNSTTSISSTEVDRQVTELALINNAGTDGMRPPGDLHDGRVYSRARLHRSSVFEIPPRRQSRSEPCGSSVTSYSCAPQQKKISKIKYGNTYRMSPPRKYLQNRVTDIIKTTLETTLADQMYSASMSVVWSKALSQQIKDKVKSCNFERYKIVCLVTIGQKSDQEVCFASRVVCDQKLDNYSSAFYENFSLFAVGVVYGFYYE